MLRAKALDFAKLRAHSRQMDGGDFKRVAEHVNRRLNELGWLQKDLEQQSGVSVATIRALQTGERTNYRPDVLAKVSRALGWPSDTLHRISRGGDAPAEEDIPADDQDLLDELDAIKSELDRRLEAVRARIARRR